LTQPLDVSINRSFKARTTASSMRTAVPQASRCSSQERPRSPLFVPTMSRTTPDGCMGGVLVLGGRLLCHSNLPRQLARLRHHGGGGLKNRRCRALCTDSGAAHPESGAAHLALHHSPLIIDIGARAALPEAARGGIHGGWSCGLCALTVLLRAESAP